jgi:hypothetical protein
MHRVFGSALNERGWVYQLATLRALREFRIPPSRVSKMAMSSRDGRRSRRFVLFSVDL